jgi:hypothetical protein
MARQQDGEPLWAPLYRLRAAEDRYGTEGQIGSVYSQIRAQKEAELGNHAAALRYWDSTRPAHNAVGELPPGTRSIDALAHLTAVADTAQVIMINERHHAASDRLLTLNLLAPLYARGFRYLAAETFSGRDTTLTKRGYPQSGLTGNYIEEPVFGEVVREALRLGYTLVPYESSGRVADEDNLTRQQRRDCGQAQNLRDRIFRQDPDAKVLVHAGFAHIQETVSPRFYPMAVYFTEMTGIDPVTVDQTTLSERSVPEHEHPIYRATLRAGHVQNDSTILQAPDGTLLTPAGFGTDLEVLTPRTTYTASRPDWMALGGRRTPTEVSVPECAKQVCIVEVRVPDESADAVPLDRAEADRQATVQLFLPAGRAVEVVTKDTADVVLETRRVR